MGKDWKSMFLLNSVRSFKLNVSKTSYALQDIICDRLTPRLNIFYKRKDNIFLK